MSEIIGLIPVLEAYHATPEFTNQNRRFSF